MRKGSTAAAKQSRNCSQQKLTIGLDLGDRNSWYSVVDEVGQIQLEQRVRTNASALREVFDVMPRSRVALETGTHSPWISRLLSELGHEVIVAHARKVRLIGESRKKDDRLDAQTLARLFALRLARHRPGVGHGRERGALDPKSCYMCWMVRPTLARDQAGPPGSGLRKAVVVINSRIVGNPEAFGTLSFHAGYATSRISSILNGRTKQFGWLRSSATKNFLPSK